MELYRKKSKSKSKSKTRKMKKYRNKSTKHKKGISSKKNKNKIRIKMIKMKGGMPIKERDDFFQKTYDEIRAYNIIEKNPLEIQDFTDKYSKLLWDNIYIKQDNQAFTNNYLAKLIINMFLPKIIQYIPKDENAVTDFETFQRYVDFVPEQGSILKEYGLTNLTKDPEQSSALLQTCVNDVSYCPMDSSRFICDYVNNVEYLCGKKDGDSIYRINDNEDLKKNKINGRYLYCLLPNGTLCLFPKGNHSAGACGQPVICAGFVDIVKNQINGIDNNSGHYRPNQEMLGKAILILTEKGIMKENQSINDNITKVIFTNGTERRGPACDTQPLSEPPDGEDRGSESLVHMNDDSVPPYSKIDSEGNSYGNSYGNGRKRTRISESSA